MDVFTTRVCVDSRYRDQTIYPNPASYVMLFEDVLRNVVSVELVSAVYETIGPDIYLSLHIDEFNTSTISNSASIKTSFTTLPLGNITNVYHCHQFQSITRLENPILKLNKLTIRFIAPSGKLYPMKDHLLRFEISTLKNVKIPDWNPGLDDAYTILGINRHTIISKETLIQAFKTKYKAWTEAGGNTKNKQDPHLIQLKHAYRHLGSVLRPVD